MKTVSGEVIFVLSPTVSKVLLLQIILYKMIWCQVSLISAGASWEPGDSAFQSNLCDWGWDGERALCAGGQGGELLAGGMKTGGSKGGARKAVYSPNNPGLPGINPASTESTEVFWLVLQTWVSAPVTSFTDIHFWLAQGCQSTAGLVYTLPYFHAKMETFWNPTWEMWNYQRKHRSPC